MRDIKLSIIIPVYNNELVGRAIESVRRVIRNKQDVELIVVDGMSTDGTIDIIRNNMDFIDVFISEKDCGPYDAANKGIRISKGKWILWLAADDELLVNPLRIICDSRVNEYDVICGSVLSEDSNGIYRIVESKKKSGELLYHCSLRQPATLYRRNKVIQVGLYNTLYAYAADREFFLRLWNNNARIVVTNCIMTRFHFGGLTTSSKVVESYKEDYRISVEYGANRLFALSLYLIRVLHFRFKQMISR